MNRRALFAAIFAAALGVLLLMLYKKRFEAETSGGPKISVLVANQDVPFGTALTESMVAPRGLPASYVEDRHIRMVDMRRVLGVRVSRSVRANESLLWTDLAVSADRGRTLADMVQPGQRALAIPATLPSTFGGLLRPGDRVDAFLTTVQRDRTRQVTLPILQNLLVLAVGSDVGVQTLRSDSEKKDDKSSRKIKLTTVTVAAGPRQAELLILAQSQGLLSLALRNPDDVEIIDGLPEARLVDLLEQSTREELQRLRRRLEPSNADEPKGPTKRTTEKKKEQKLERID